MDTLPKTFDCPISLSTACLFRNAKFHSVSGISTSQGGVLVSIDLSLCLL